MGGRSTCVSGHVPPSLPGSEKPRTPGPSTPGPSARRTFFERIDVLSFRKTLIATFGESQMFRIKSHQQPSHNNTQYISQTFGKLQSWFKVAAIERLSICVVFAAHPIKTILSTQSSYNLENPFCRTIITTIAEQCFKCIFVANQNQDLDRFTRSSGSKTCLDRV